MRFPRVVVATLLVLTTWAGMVAAGVGSTGIGAMGQGRLTHDRLTAAEESTQHGAAWYSERKCVEGQNVCVGGVVEGHACSPLSSTAEGCNTMKTDHSCAEVMWPGIDDCSGTTLTLCPAPVVYKCLLTPEGPQWKRTTTPPNSTNCGLYNICN